jgi:excisionase family DNA binding protein
MPLLSIARPREQKSNTAPNPQASRKEARCAIYPHYKKAAASCEERLMEKLLDSRAVAELLGVSFFHVEQLRKSGKLASIKIGQKKLYRFTEEAVQSFITSLSSEQPSAGVRSLRKLGAAK